MKKEKQKEIEQQIIINNMQEEFFGRRFLGATLDEVDFSLKSQEQLADWLCEPKGFLYIFGPPGVGKTYLCAAILAHSLADEKIESIGIFEEAELYSALRNTFSENQGDYRLLLKQLMSYHMIILDHMGIVLRSEWRDEVLGDAVNMRYRAMLPTVIASNVPPKDLPDLVGERTASQILGNPSVQIDLSNECYLRKNN